jgi:hypothetical protein
MQQQDAVSLPPSLKQQISPKQIAHWLNVSVGWVHDHASGKREPVLPSRPLGKLLRFDVDEVNAWLLKLPRKKAA